MQYKYKVASGDSLWKLAQEYTKIKTGLSNEQAQKAIRDLNPSMKSLKAGDIINLPFDKGTTAADLKPKTAYEKWQDTVDRGLEDSRWDEYDDIIKAIVREYNNRLGKKSRYVESPMPRLDWLWIKAMIWVESGGPDNPTWKTRTMHIGNQYDLGYPALKKREGTADIIMDGKLKANLFNIETPRVNINAGTAYLLTRLSKSDIKSLRSVTDNKEYSYTVVAGDNLDKIAKKVGSTVDEFKASNPNIGAIIKKGDTIKYHKASKERVIVGWRRPITARLLYERYNTGDLNYSKKLMYVIDEIFTKK